MNIDQAPHELDDKLDKLVGRISLWTSILLATAICVWYYNHNPPDSEEMQKMRLFFRDNALVVSEFIQMKPDQQKKFAETQSHPFFKSYVKASEVEKDKINALIHVSTDYTPNQYWFNMLFLWGIFFTTFWFIGLMTQGVINLVRRENKKD